MSKVISTDVPDDLAERIEAEQEEGESRSATVRRLIRRGLDADQSPIASTLAVIGAVTIGIAIEPVAPPELFVGIGVVLFVLSIAIQKGLLSR